jgi:hypothetical protein
MKPWTRTTFVSLRACHDAHRIASAIANPLIESPLPRADGEAEGDSPLKRRRLRWRGWRATLAVLSTLLLAMVFLSMVVGLTIALAKYWRS